MLEYASICAMHNMDFTKMSFMKHIIKHKDNMLFKDCYRCILPSMYNEV